MPSVEFIVEGVAISHQTKNKATLQAWKAMVADAAWKAWSQQPMTGKLQCTIMNFHDGIDAPCDDDNMAKPIRDALESIIYENDNQISHGRYVQISNSAPFRIRGASKLVVDALREEKEFVCIRIAEAPQETELPR